MQKNIKGIKRLFTIGSIIFACSANLSVAALEFEEILFLACRNDRRTEILARTVENKRLVTRRSNLDPAFSMAFDLGKNDKTELTGGNVIHFFAIEDIENTDTDESRDSSTQISVAPELTFTMPHPALTTITTSSDIFFEFSEDPAVESYVVPSISLRQPLSALFGLEPSKELTELQNLLALETAILDLYQREIEVRKQAVALLKECVSLKRSIEEAGRNLKEAEKELEKQKTLKSYGEESYKYKQLIFDVDRYTRELELYELKRDRKLDSFQSLLGVELDTLPETIPEVQLTVNEQAPMSPALYLAELSLRVARAALAKEKEKTPPEFYFGGGYRATIDNMEYATEPEDRVSHSVSGSIGAVFEDFSLSAGVSSNITNKKLGADLSFSYDLPDNRARDLRVSERENDLEIAELKLEEAKMEHINTFASLALSVSELEYRGATLAKTKDLASRKFEENKLWYRQGLVSEDELNQTEWEYLETLYDGRLLLMDRYSLMLDIAKMSLHEKLTAKD